MTEKKKVNRYAGEIRINPVAILRHDDFNNSGHIEDVDALLAEAIAINLEISERIARLRAYLKKSRFRNQPGFHFAEGGYIIVRGLSDEELKVMHSNGLIDLFDFATDRDWVKLHGAKFGLMWEGGRAIEIG